MDHFVPAQHSKYSTAATPRYETDAGVCTYTAVRTSKQHLDDLRDGSEVWLEGERAKDVQAHLRLLWVAHMLAGLYELQLDPALSLDMTFTPPSSGDSVALSYVCAGHRAV